MSQQRNTPEVNVSGPTNGRGTPYSNPYAPSAGGSSHAPAAGNPYRRPSRGPSPNRRPSQPMRRSDAPQQQQRRFSDQNDRHASSAPPSGARDLSPVPNKPLPRPPGGATGAGTRNRSPDPYRNTPPASPLQTVERHHAHPKDRENFMKDILNAFMAIDLDYSGAISESELYAAMKKVDPMSTETQAKGIMAQLDADRSGSVTVDEFMAAAQRGKINPSLFLAQGGKRRSPAPVADHDKKFEWEIEYDELKFGMLLGEGSFGTVKKGEWRGSVVAIKELKNTVQGGEEGLEDFRKELSLLSKLRHPNIVLLLCASTSPPHLCMVTEFLAGGTVFSIVHQKKIQLNKHQFVKISLDTAKGMNYLHLNKPRIIHRDLKSLNILLDENLGAKVCDFGLSRVKDDTNSLMTGQIGTPLWMAPELIRNEDYGEKVDVFSYGIVLWEMFTNKIPYPGMEPMQIAMAVAYQGLRPQLTDDTPPTLATLMKACWHENPEKRPSFSRIIEILQAM